MSRVFVVAGEVRVRPPNDGDPDAIAELLGQLGYPSTAQQVRDRLAALGRSPNDHVLLAEVEGRVAGLAAVQIGLHLEKDGTHAQLTALVTGERFRRRGVARVLLRAAEDLANEQGAELLFLRSNKRRTDAHEFYRAAGYEETHLTFNKAL